MQDSSQNASTTEQARRGTDRPSYMIPPPPGSMRACNQGKKDPVLTRLAKGMVGAMVANLNKATEEHDADDAPPDSAPATP